MRNRIGVVWPLLRLIAICLLPVGVLGSPAPTACAAEQSDAWWHCVPQFSQEPAAGTWHGTHELDYKMTMPGAPAAFTYEVRGDIDLKIKREKDERKRRSPCPRGFVGTAPDFRAPPEAGCNVDQTPVEPLDRLEEKQPELTGDAPTEVHGFFNMTMPGMAARAVAQTPVRAQLKPEATFNGDAPQIQTIKLMGEPSQFQFDGTGSARAGGANVTTTGHISGTGQSSMRQKIRTPDATGTTNSSNKGDGRTSQNYDIKTRDGHVKGSHSAAAPVAGDDTRRAMFTLTIETRECGEMKGAIDTTALRDMARSQGMTTTFTTAKWSAELHERDKGFEEAVARYVKRPFEGGGSDPNHAWTVWEREWTDYKALRRDNPSDYELCVLKPAHERMIKVTTLTMHAVLAAARASGKAPDMPVRSRLARLMSVMEGFGRKNFERCPVVREASEFMYGSKLPLPDPNDKTPDDSRPLPPSLHH